MSPKNNSPSLSCSLLPSPLLPVPSSPKSLALPGAPGPEIPAFESHSCLTIVLAVGCESVLRVALTKQADSFVQQNYVSSVWMKESGFPTDLSAPLRPAPGGLQERKGSHGTCSRCLSAATARSRSEWMRSTSSCRLPRASSRLCSRMSFSAWGRERSFWGAGFPRGLP